jgi:two-component system cell cycle response regulator
MKIMVVDDDPTSRLIARMAVQRLGHECETVADGTEAWNAFPSTRPDVVISDWMMPGLDGLQLCRNIRAHGSGGYTYLVLLTSRGAHGQILEGMSAGADDYLLKPLDPDELQVRLIAAERVTALHRQLAEQRSELQGLNSELTILARRDPLTGLGNRQAMQEGLELLEAQVARYGHRYCIALLDIDHFKSFNDTHGHQAGDHVLSSVSAALQAGARSGDSLFRYGGEEFLVIFPEQTLATGLDANSIGVVTLSAGVAMLDPADDRPVGEVLKDTDIALYRAKQLGRNRVVSAGSLTATRSPHPEPARTITQ